jgi:hypothetical protein
MYAWRSVAETGVFRFKLSSRRNVAIDALAPCARHVAVEPALHHRAQQLPPVGDWDVPLLPQLRLQRLKLGGKVLMNELALRIKADHWRVIQRIRVALQLSLVFLLAEVLAWLFSVADV